MGRGYTMTETAELLGVHRNTIRNYIRRGKLKAELDTTGYGVPTWVIEEYDLYHSGVPSIMKKLGPQALQATSQEVPNDTTGGTTRYADPKIFVEHITKLTDTLISTTRELDTMRFEQKALMAAKEERDQLLEERDQLANEKALLQAALADAQANAKWSWRRQLKKASG